MPPFKNCFLSYAKPCRARSAGPRPEKEPAAAQKRSAKLNAIFKKLYVNRALCRIPAEKRSKAEEASGRKFPHNSRRSAVISAAIIFVE